ncbi:hypothetical protein LPJ70_001868 [Coemansia sp. RSA 2708]|nr:hypothetical protein LPJ70_001868 [Coemansia sp. RSA 2708]
MNLAVLLAAAAAAAVPAHRAQPYLTAQTSAFGALIEGAGVDSLGRLYAVHYNASTAAVGRVFPAQELFYADRARPAAWFNGVRFGGGAALLADVRGHRVARVRDMGAFSHAETRCHDAAMLQPNDLALAHSTGRLFLSGMNYTRDSAVGSGDLWTCDARGVATRLGLFHRTNGIELSPDERTLYLSEAENKGGAVVANRILAFDVDAATGAVSNRRTFADFGALDGSAASDVDGMRADERGFLYVARWGRGRVAVLTPAGALHAYILLSTISEVTSVELAGPAGRDLFAVGACSADPARGCVERWPAPARGRAFARLQGQ